MMTTTKEKINLLYTELKGCIGLDLLELKTLQFLQRLKKREVAPVPSQRRVSNETYQLIVQELNNMSGKNYRWNTPETKALIRARFNDGFSQADFEKVIWIKTRHWLGDDKYQRYLRPKTLFGSKFEDYLQEWVSHQRKEKQQKAEYEKARRVEQGLPDEDISPEELKKQEEWRELSKKLLAKATQEDWQKFYQQLTPIFKKLAYEKKLGDSLVKNLYVQWLKENLSTDYTN